MKNTLMIKNEDLCVKFNNHVNVFNPLVSPLLYSFTITSSSNDDEEEVE